MKLPVKFLRRFFFTIFLAGFAALVIYCCFEFYDNGYNYNYTLVDGDNNKVKDLMGLMHGMEDLIGKETLKVKYIHQAMLKKTRSNHSTNVKNNFLNASNQNQTQRACNKPIAVLVFACDRPLAVKAQLMKLLKYRKSKQLFSIIVSQDCDDEKVANVVNAFGSDVDYIKHLSGETAGVTVPIAHNRYKSYYLIARHYKMGLSYVFDKQNFDSVIIVEDDLDISEDFYEYFCGTRWLLDEDDSLFCISAWNDNGRASLIDLKAHSKLYRSDFFPGLGWLMTKKLWKELKSQWPLGFWDDWIRDPARRKGRSCIRPEISRTAMTNFGKKGASKGLFFNYYLKKIFLNNVPVDFERIDNSYLLKSKYDDAFLKEISELPTISIKTFLQLSKTGKFKIMYKTMPEYTKIAKALKLMADTKAGVQRTAYKGIVTCFIKGSRVYLVPKNYETWKYDTQWEAPADVLSPVDENDDL